MIVMTLIGILLRLALVLQPEPFWYDEAFSYIVAVLPVDRLIEATAGDVHPPAYYMLLHGWLDLCPHTMRMEVAARSLSFVLSLAALTLYARVLRMFTLSPIQRRMAWLVCLFLPGLVYYAAEARMYALLECYVLAALLLLGKASPTTFDLIAGGLCLSGAALTHNAGIIWSGLIILVCLVQRRTLRVALLPGAVAALGYVGWLPTFIGQLAATSDGYWIWPPTVGTVAYMQFMSLVFSRNLLTTGVDCLMMLLVGPLTTFGVIMMARRWPATLILTVGFPVVAFIGSHLVGVAFMLHRLFIPGTFFIAVAWSLILSRRDVGVILSLVMVVSLAFINGVDLVRGRTGVTYDLVLSELNSAPADLIYGNNTAIVPVSLYSGIPAVVMDTNEPIGSGLSRRTLRAMGIPMLSLDAFPWSRAWMLSFITPDSSGDYEHIVDMVEKYSGKFVDGNDHEFYSWQLFRLERNGN